VDSKDEIVILEVYNNSELFGVARIPLSKITNQDENRVELDIEKDGQRIVLSIKVTFIWSYYKLFEDSYLEAQRNLAELKASLDKRIQVLENLSGKGKY
jgi:hypothetical protein